eukprot:TRINITY_DN7718_c0_g1_i2.p1 TRINITY_DN7718_c0_g1~~TRINITY_DN7718_c0_g1_i2.p1  ORF type:complete len:274 (+),score=105.94 TRINITY_DN7718_c0_g1_i2:350-1171(+)
MFLGLFVLSQLFVAVLLEQFDEGTSFDPRYRKRLQRAWMKHAGQTNKIPTAALPDFLYDVGPPLGLCPGSGITADFIASLRLRTFEALGTEYVLHSELYPKLFHAAYETDLPEARQKQLLESLKKNSGTDTAQLRGEVPKEVFYRILTLQRIGRALLPRLRLGLFRRVSLAAAAAYDRYETDDGIPYYHNAYTGDTSWTNPAGANAVEQPAWEEELRKTVAPAAGPALPPTAPDADREEKWIEFSDQKGRAYYYDVNSGRTTWVEPPFYSFEV